jgi:predicted transglutaminase-like cysteine proteinase
MKKIKSFKAFLASLALIAAAHANAEPSNIQGFDDYCSKNTAPQVCKGTDRASLHIIKKLSKNSYTSQAVIPKGTLNDLISVNKQVNKDIEYVHDIDNGQGLDKWDIPTNGKGDCEDYVLTKMQKLVSLGWNSSSLRMALQKSPTGYHSVLIATLNNESYVLDIWPEVPVKISSYNLNGNRWAFIQIPGSTKFVSFNGNI